MAWINDCVYCSYEDDNWCNYFEENIFNPDNTWDLDNKNNTARRMQNKCRGFELLPSMKKSWDDTFGNQKSLNHSQKEHHLSESSPKVKKSTSNESNTGGAIIGIIFLCVIGYFFGAEAVWTLLKWTVFLPFTIAYYILSWIF